MKNQTRNRALTAGLLAAAFVLAAGPSGAHGTEAHAAGKTGRVPLPVHTEARGEQCVEPTEVMRRDHMKFILHQRDKTMHEGIRTTRHSLKNCVDCHADPKTQSVMGKDGFCSSCHQYAAVTIDCFGCHTHKRDESAAGSAEPAARALNAAAARASAGAVAPGARP